MSDLAGVQVIVSGYVQGVYFRAFASRAAKGLGLKGYVRNLSSGGQVEIRAEGERQLLEKLIQQLEIGPPEAIVEKMETNWLSYSGIFSNFEIRF